MSWLLFFLFYLFLLPFLRSCFRCIHSYKEMSEKTKTELAMTKPLSRFGEHFDLMPPSELLVDEPLAQQGKRFVSPLSASPHRPCTKHPSNLNIKSAEPSHTWATPYTPTSPIIGGPNYSRSVSPLSPAPITDPGQRLGYSTNEFTKYPKQAGAKRSKNFNNLKITANQDYAASSASKPKLLRSSLNRADIIIKRYEAWSNFISLIISWVGEISRLSLQSEQSFSSLLKESRFSNLKGSGGPIESANGIHATIVGFTADLALQEQRFGHCLKEQVLDLEKFKKECTTQVKGLKSRSDLALDEFFRRAESTAGLMAQLNKACKKARRALEKGAQLTNDPWIVNLYVLRELKREVDEENRQRRLMVPIQQTMCDFETRLLRAVEETVKICFARPGGKSLTEERLNSLETSLNAAVTDNWDAFVQSNKKDIVSESKPNKHYLKINYPCKNDPLVTTLHKGVLERKSGVLNRYTQRFFVLTESGFLHQFKLKDKVSPEFSIYIPKATIIPDTDISRLSPTTFQSSEEPDKQGSHYSFEIQRSGSVLQRDKSYMFRTVSLLDMAKWCKLLGDVATRPIGSVAQ